MHKVEKVSAKELDHLSDFSIYEGERFAHLDHVKGQCHSEGWGDFWPPPGPVAMSLSDEDLDQEVSNGKI